MELTYNVSDESQLNDIALELLNKFDLKLFLFYGKMGVGKTTFIKKFCDKLGVKDIVSSPSFSIINQYKSMSEIDVFHFDFYSTIYVFFITNIINFLFTCSSIKIKVRD